MLKLYFFYKYILFENGIWRLARLRNGKIMVIKLVMAGYWYSQND